MAALWAAPALQGSASVERFFLAMTSPGLTRRREAPTSGGDQLSLTNAFQGFEWD